VGESQPLQRGIHGADDHRPGVMSVERGGAGGVKLVRREQRLQPRAFFLPLLIGGVEDLRQSSPADVTDERSLLVLGCRAAVGFEALEQRDGFKVGAAFLLQRAGSDPVGISDAIIARIAERLRFGGDLRNVWCVRRLYFSGGRKM
jgi:hypothetical protein